MIIKKIKSIYFRYISANAYAKQKGVQFGENCYFRTKQFGSEPFLIKIGDNVATSSGVEFVTHDGSLHVLRNLYKEYQNADLFKPITIGNNVFIGMDTILLPGSVVDDNVIIGAGSIVRGHLKSNSIYAGVPVKRICSIEDYKNKNSSYFIFTKNLNYDEKNKKLHEEFQDFLNA